MSGQNEERPTCATCKHWKIRNPGEAFLGGDCHRHPPVLVNWGGGWPRTQHDDWCGEYAPVPAKEEARG